MSEELPGVACLDCRDAILLACVVTPGWETSLPEEFERMLTETETNHVVLFATAHEGHRVKWSVFDSLDEFRGFCSGNIEP